MGLTATLAALEREVEKTLAKARRAERAGEYGKAEGLYARARRLEREAAKALFAEEARFLATA